MARIAGVDLPRDKRVEIGLTYIYGIGQTTASKILAETGIDPDIRVPGKAGNPYHRILQHAEAVKRFRNCIPPCSCLFFCRTIHRYRGSDQFI